MWPFDDIGSQLGGKLNELVSSAFDSAMRAVWDASLAILRESFRLADQFSVFTVDTRTGPISVLWPMMLWISGVLALGLFFWQLTTTSLRGGRGFMRLVGGPVQYGIALAVTVGLVGSFLAAADGLTEGVLRYGLQSSNFQDALTHTTFVDGAVDGVQAVVLGICALVGIIPAGIGYVLEMLFREAAIYVLVATLPIAAAGLLANVTKSWLWKTVRWIMSCIAMKPVLALTLVLGVAISGGSKGLSGLLAGVGVLIISLLVPFVLFRLFSFMDPNSDAGVAFRDALSSAGVDSYGAKNPVMQAGSALSGSGGSGGGDVGGSDAQESANTGRFDEAMADYGGEEMGTYGVGQGSVGGGGSGGGAQGTPSASDSGGDDGGDSVSAEQAETTAPASPSPGGASDSSGSGSTGPGDSGGDSGGGGHDEDGGDDPPLPGMPGPGGGPFDDDGGGGGGPRGGGGGPSSGGGGGAASSGEAAEAAVIV